MQQSQSALQATQAVESRIEANENLMRSFIERVLNQGDYSFLKYSLHPDYVYRSPEQELRGVDAIQALFETYRSAFPDLHLTIDRLLATQDQVAVAFNLTGTHEGEFIGIGPTGNSVSINGTLFSRIQEGQIAEEWEVVDQFSLLAQLGISAMSD